MIFKDMRGATTRIKCIDVDENIRRFVRNVYSDVCLEKIRIYFRTAQRLLWFSLGIV